MKVAFRSCAGSRRSKRRSGPSSLPRRLDWPPMTGPRDPRAERALLRIGAVSPIVGLVVIFVAEVFHGGHEPANLRATLPVYADNPYWEAVHIGQFLGFLLLLPGFVALHRSIRESASGALARLGFVFALVGLAIYGANQGVDGVAIQFVAEQWVEAPAVEKQDAFRLANSVRHIEIGLSSFTELALAIALLLFGLAIGLGEAYPRSLGWSAIAIGTIYGAVGVLVAHHGFTNVGVSQAASVLFAIWLIALAANLWRKARESSGQSRERT